jgi:hypothetical protein
MQRFPAPDAPGERVLLLGWLDFHRDALAAKCADLTDEQLVTASAPPSSLTLLGLVRHLTEMERHYLIRALSGVSHPLNYVTDDDEEADVERLDASMVADSLARWEADKAAADALIATHEDLDAPVAMEWNSVRWHIMKVLLEYARHNGHADIIRERIDGLRGE